MHFCGTPALEGNISTGCCGSIYFCGSGFGFLCWIARAGPQTASALKRWRGFPFL
jgi:hypothetical protein